jgi:hypothetical protein
VEKNIARMEIQQTNMEILTPIVVTCPIFEESFGKYIRKRTITDKESASIIFNELGLFFVRAKTRADPADVQATIHSHPTEVLEKGTTVYRQLATPFPQDRMALKDYNTNIIVGRLDEPKLTRSQDGSLDVKHGPLGAAIYTNRFQPVIRISQSAINKIVQSQ